ncbi:type IX secretion system sortase PorU [Terrimonas pollutisoli]|uniref:type IX secretion system sortase PorU n=1 Tax=Terrimonas pollutisoli TaxID=3034147 RepID=UPI0023EB55F8|nr:type IX secretion system sortase PorU [Terrimonas sp. H1YJ31]
MAQRSYASHSVLASGNWYQLSVTTAGIYKIDLAFLNRLGVNTTSLSSQTVQLFGNGGQMLAEANAGLWLDDLQENAIMVVDGGDGVLNGNDHILFYAPGPDQWLKDSANQRFIHKKNIYSDKTFYYLRIGANGKRVKEAPHAGSPTIFISSFSGRYFHELDTVNFLNSGKEWYGEEFSNMPGRGLTRSFPVTISNIVSGSQLTVQANCVARSAGAGSFFDIQLNNAALGKLNIQPVGTGPYDQFAQQAVHLSAAVLLQENNVISYTYAPGSFNAQGWLNWFELFYRQQLSLKNLDQLLFRDWASVGNHTGEFVIAEVSSASQVWDITDPLTPVSMPSSITGNTLKFSNNCSRLKEYIVFKETNLLTPVSGGKIANQDLHATAPVDYIIITHPPFLSQAQRLARFHEQRNGLRSLVVTTDQVYHEFASGSPDPVAIRDFVKMYYDKYNADPATRLRYLLLFGDACYDYRNRLINNTNFVPAWQSAISLDVLSTYTSDDFFGFLDDTEDINSGVASNYLDIGIGRVPAKNIDEAKNFVDKVEAYFDAKSYGPWRTNLTFIADDEDQNLHLQDAEQVSGTAANTAPLFDLQKIYLDAYQQESGSGGGRYPTANQAINNQVFAGTLIWNFNGHGSPQRLAEETILDQDIINGWNNPNRLPLFITATCDFAPYDNPLINSIGENILVRPKTGGIALMATTRTVFAFSNRVMNDNYLKFALEPDANGKYRSLGDAVKEAKNYTYQTSADITNNRKFTLLGDPALTLAFPTIKARPTTLNGKAIAQTDTLSATEKIILEGVVADLSDNLLSQFNGNIYATVFDKPKQVTTLANDPGSTKTSFAIQSNILFKGKATVTAGKFVISFRVPKDINYQYGKGKLSLYAENGSLDGSGYFSNFLIGGTANELGNDKEGPEIKPFLNDEKFVNGSVTNELPVLILKLSDSSGINTVGTGIGHDIIATLDNDNNRFFILNDFYEGELNSYQKGSIRFQMPELEPGPHTLKIKAWDTMNNSTEVLLEFVVAKDEELSLQHVLNYPNPFTTKTQFWFEHNKPGQDLKVRLQIFTLSGRVIKTMQKAINTAGNRSSELEWDGRDEYGDRVGKGVYFYKLTVIAPGRLKKEKIEKLVIF